MERRDSKGRFLKGFKHTEESKRKIAEASKGNKNMLGKHQTKEAKNKIRLALSGEKNRLFGKHLPEEIKKKIRLNHADFKGKNSPVWKGGIKKQSAGYLLIWSINHPNKSVDGYVYEHRLVMENHLGRYLTSEEQVHHINRDTSDNRIENLILFENNSAHMRYHKELRMATK